MLYPDFGYILVGARSFNLALYLPRTESVGLSSDKVVFRERPQACSSEKWGNPATHAVHYPCLWMVPRLRKTKNQPQPGAFGLGRNQNLAAWHSRLPVLTWLKNSKRCKSRRAVSHQTKKAASMFQISVHTLLTQLPTYCNELRMGTLAPSDSLKFSPGHMSLVTTTRALYPTSIAVHYTRCMRSAPQSCVCRKLLPPKAYDVARGKGGDVGFVCLVDSFTPPHPSPCLLRYNQTVCKCQTALAAVQRPPRDCAPQARGAQPLKTFDLLALHPPKVSLFRTTRRANWDNAPLCGEQYKDYKSH